MKNWLLAASLLYGTISTAHADVPTDRLTTLSRGANISSVFETKSDPELTLEQIVSHGFKHVRVFVSIESLGDAAYLHRLDRLLREAVDHRLGIILCMTSRTDKWGNAAGENNEKSWTAAWLLLAHRYRTSSADYVFFEMANEPQTDKWDLIQNHLRQAVRGVLPLHTILLTGSPLSMVWSLPDIDWTDDNVAYVFHLYQPMLVTHQGAEWSPEYLPFVGLSYPPNMDNIKNLTTAQTAERLQAYAHDGRTAMQREIDVASAWQGKTHIPLICDEFGVYGKAPAATRAAWLTEARTRLEAAHIGWTVWEFRGGFGIDTPQMLHALGMNQ